MNESGYSIGGLHMVMSKPKGRTATSPQRPPPKKQEMSSVYVVFASTANAETGGQVSRNIIGIFEHPEEAERIEKKFNEEKEKADGVITRAYSIRYALPYLAPALKDLLE